MFVRRTGVWLVMALALAATPAAAAKKMPQVEPEPGKALVYFYRPPTMMNVAPKAAFSLDERGVVELPWGGCAFIQVTPGRHVIGMRWTGMFAPTPGYHENPGVIFWAIGKMVRPKPETPPPDPTLRASNDFKAGQVYLNQTNFHEAFGDGGRVLHYAWDLVPTDPVSGLPTMRECRYFPAAEAER